MHTTNMIEILETIETDIDDWLFSGSLDIFQVVDIYIYNVHCLYVCLCRVKG
jgi:hypothetical protein